MNSSQPQSHDIHRPNAYSHIDITHLPKEIQDILREYMILKQRIEKNSRKQ